MKFAGALRNCGYNTAISDVYATYKAAKQLLKRGDAAPLALLLAQKVDAWNDSYMDAEENFVIESSELQQLSDEHDANDTSTTYALLESLVDFQGRCATVELRREFCTRCAACSSVPRPPWPGVASRARHSTLRAAAAASYAAASSA